MRKRTGIQLAVPFSERRLKNEGRFHLKWSPPYIIQPKLDGERCRAIVTSGRCLLLSSTEDIIPSVPHINKEFLRKFPDGEYDGELYLHGWSQSKIHSIVSSRNNLHPEYEKIQFHCFDVIKDSPQIVRAADLLNIFKVKRSEVILKVDTLIVNNLKEILYYYDKYISMGYEGFILRHIDIKYTRARTAGMMKFKPKKKDSYRISSINEAVSESGIRLGMVGSFTCIDENGVKFNVGAGKLTHPERIRLYKLYLYHPNAILNSKLEIEYQTLSSKNKVPLFSRAVKVVPANGKKDE